LRLTRRDGEPAAVGVGGQVRALGGKSGVPARRSLVAAACRGDQRCWDELVDCYAQAVWDAAREHGLDVAEAAELCQLVWCRFADRLAQFPTDREAGEWLCREADREARVRGATPGARAPA